MTWLLMMSVVVKKTTHSQFLNILILIGFLNIGRLLTFILKGRDISGCDLKHILGHCTL